MLEERVCDAKHRGRIAQSAMKNCKSQATKQFYVIPRLDRGTQAIKPASSNHKLKN
jgi:hypothetical protein